MSDRSTWRILIVEDDPGGRRMLTQLLSHVGITVDSAETAEMAIQLLATNQYTAALIDLALPEMDGLELVQYIREQPSGAQFPCVAMTAFDASLVEQKAWDVGFNAYVTKPISFKTLLFELERVISAG